MLFFNQKEFIKKHVIKRPQSLFQNDIENNKAKLAQELKGKNVLVIGGAGTIGSSFIKAILPFLPGRLVVVDYSENGLTELTRDLRSSYQEYMPEEYITYPFDFGGEIFEKFMQDHSFDVIACFAAHKHVRSEKDSLAIEAMIKNNVFNTKKLLDLALINPPSHFFCVSTDKAANPVNVMGASKKVMEKVLMSYSDKLKITTARFANVAFSNGSLLFGFIERMMKNQPLSSPMDVKRYFVSPEESGQLCMLACVLGKSSEIFFPKLSQDEMLTFSFIAEKFLQDIGLTADQSASADEARRKAVNRSFEDKNYPVYFFKTDTSGEKSYEEFFTDRDEVDMKRLEALGIVMNSEKPEEKAVSEMLAAFERMFENNSTSKSEIVALLGKYLPDFSHIETGKSLDQKM